MALYHIAHFSELQALKADVSAALPDLHFAVLVFARTLVANEFRGGGSDVKIRLIDVFIAADPNHQGTRSDEAETQNVRGSAEENKISFVMEQSGDWSCRAAVFNSG